MVESKADLPNAIALQSMLFNGARFVGPTIAGVILAFAGEALCFLLNGISYLAVVVAYLLVRVAARPPSTERKPLLDELMAGFRYAFGEPAMRRLLWLLAALSVFTAPWQSLMPIYAGETFAGDSKTLGLLIGAVGFGALAATGFLAVRPSVRGLGRIIASAGLVAALALTGFALSHYLWLSLVLLATFGFGLIAAVASTNTILQTIADDDKRGRIISIYVMTFLGLAPISNFVAGAVAEAIGAHWTIFACGVGLTLADRCVRPQLRQLAPVHPPDLRQAGNHPAAADRDAVAASRSCSTQAGTLPSGPTGGSGAALSTTERDEHGRERGHGGRCDRERDLFHHDHPALLRREARTTSLHAGGAGGAGTPRGSAATECGKSMAFAAVRAVPQHRWCIVAATLSHRPRMSRRIAIVEDDAAIRENVADTLRRQGYEVTAHADRAQALAAFQGRLPDLAIVDIGLGTEVDGGFTLVRELRAMSAELPIIFLTARDSDFDLVAGLRLGADDYLTKNISMPHLLARIAALFRRSDVLRSPPKSEETVDRGPLRLDLKRMTAAWRGQPVDLTLTEFWMVHALAKYPGHVKNRDSLMSDANLVVDDATVTSHIKRIRKKFVAVDPAFDAIDTVYGMGYRWVSG